jgi:hypothetical protein
MNRHRYEGCVALRDAVARQALADHPAAVPADLAEGLLLARDEEARKAAVPVPGSLASLSLAASCRGSQRIASGPCSESAGRYSSGPHRGTTRSQNRAGRRCAAIDLDET